MWTTLSAAASTLLRGSSHGPVRVRPLMPGALLLAAGVATALDTAAAGACKPIRFAPGQSSATVRGTARSDGPFECFTLATARGQTATLRMVLSNPNDDAAFGIEGVADDRVEATFKTDAKTYTITVFRTFARESDEPFALQVSVR